MKKVISLMSAIFIIAFLFCGCGEKVNTEKCAKMAFEYINKEIGTKIIPKECYVYVNQHSKDYSYYSPSQEKEITEYEDVIARVYTFTDDHKRMVVFIKKGAEKDYEKNGVSDDYFSLFLILDESDIRASIYNDDSIKYKEAVEIYTWKEVSAQNKAYALTYEEMQKADKVPPKKIYEK